MGGLLEEGSGKPRLTWPESVDEALCYGWIDGVRRSVVARRYTIRFNPRRQGSAWSAVNLRRVAELIAARRMRAAGRRVFAARSEDPSRRYSYEQRGKTLAPEYRRVLERNLEARAHWQAQPPGYRRIVSWWVMSAKKEETRRRRLDRLIASSAAGRRVGLLERAKPLI